MRREDVTQKPSLVSGNVIDFVRGTSELKFHASFSPPLFKARKTPISLKFSDYPLKCLLNFVTLNCIQKIAQVNFCWFCLKV